MKKNNNIEETLYNSPVLTSREQEIFNMLLDGDTSKEIAYSLGIKLPTICFHQKNIFRKLNVQNINELLIKFSYRLQNQNNINQKNYLSAIISKWRIFKDEHGSTVGMTIKDEIIKNNYFTCCYFFGTLSIEHSAHAGVIAYPDFSTHETMKKMTSFSFTALGDGNTYEVLIATYDTITEGEQNHFRKKFITIKNIITTFSININELAQSPIFGKKVKFNLENIESIQFQPFCTGDYNIKIYDVRIH